MLLAILEENEGTYTVSSFGYANQLFPNVSFSRDNTINQEFLDENNAVVVDESWRPTFDPNLQYTRKVDPYVLEGQTVVNFVALSYTVEQLQEKALQPFFVANYAGFWQELIRSVIYTTLKDAAKVDLAANVLATELISIFSDAKSGNLDVEAMQQGIWETVGALNAIDPALVTDLSVMMTTHGLDVYTLTPPPA